MFVLVFFLFSCSFTAHTPDSSVLREGMSRNLLVLLFTAAGAALGFRVVESYREDARKRRSEMIEQIVEEEKAKWREEHVW